MTAALVNEQKPLPSQLHYSAITPLRGDVLSLTSRFLARMPQADLQNRRPPKTPLDRPPSGRLDDDNQRWARRRWQVVEVPLRR